MKEVWQALKPGIVGDAFEVRGELVIESGPFETDESGIKVSRIPGATITVKNEFGNQASFRLVGSMCDHVAEAILKASEIK